jgi:hypothetical protein
VAGRPQEMANQAVRFYQRQIPVLALLFAEPSLLARHGEALAAVGAGPQRANQALAAYLRAERDLGRIPSSVHLDAGAAMLLDACFQRAFLSAFSGQPIPAAELTHLAASLVTTLLPDRAHRGTGAPERASEEPDRGTDS